MAVKKKTRADLRFEKEANALKKNLEKRKKQQEELDKKKKDCHNTGDTRA